MEERGNNYKPGYPRIEALAFRPLLRLHALLQQRPYPTPAGQYLVPGLYPYLEGCTESRRCAVVGRGERLQRIRSGCERIRLEDSQLGGGAMAADAVEETNFSVLSFVSFMFWE